ncbi:MAG: hypothetical protein WDA16_04955 [Candidatus Thermoplasmatota archaeon]
MLRSTLLATLLASFAITGCTVNQSTAPTTTPTTPTQNPAAPTELAFVATQSGPPGNNTTYAFSGPDTAAAGWVTLRLQNAGIEPHQLALFTLGNLTFQQVKALIMSPPNSSGMANMSTGPQPVGGIAVANPGSNATTVVRLAAGEYAIACFIPDDTGTPHAIHGMIAPLHIITARGDPAPEPTADTTITLTDYNFTLDHELTTGEHVVAVKNAGSHDHEAVLVRLHGNATAMDVINAFAPDAPPGPPPADGIGGGAAMAPGISPEYAMLTITPGRYALICFEADDDQSPPHFALGMTKEFTVA